MYFVYYYILIIISIFVFRQFLKTRSEELNLVKFEQKGLDSLTKATELYEFGSIQIKKRLYSEATKTFLKAIENYENEPDEAKAIINNALGFSYAAQNEYKKAIKHYNSAIKSRFRKTFGAPQHEKNIAKEKNLKRSNPLNFHVESDFRIRKCI